MNCSQTLNHALINHTRFELEGISSKADTQHILEEILNMPTANLSQHEGLKNLSERKLWQLAKNKDHAAINELKSRGKYLPARAHCTPH